jgi:dihydroflavonol-4-reductase
MKTLVTGAAGFIGAAVVRRLKSRGRQVRVMLEPGFKPRVDTLAGLDVERVEGDVLDREALSRALSGCDVVYHLAAIYSLWSPRPERIYEVNVEGSKNLLFAALRAGVRRVVYTSSIAAVGRRPAGPGDDAPADETCQFSPIDWRDGNAYIRSKWLSERDALRFAAEGLPLVVVNPAFPFGEGDVAPTPTGGYLIEALHRRIPGCFPGGFCAIDVDDLAEGHVLAEERGRLGERYLLGNHNVTYKEFYQVFQQVTGVRVPLVRLPPALCYAIGYGMEFVADHVTQKPPRSTYKAARQVSRRLYFDNRKAREELGLPVTPLAVTIEKAVRWFRDHGYAP